MVKRNEIFERGMMGYLWDETVFVGIWGMGFEIVLLILQLVLVEFSGLFLLAG